MVVLHTAPDIYPPFARKVASTVDLAPWPLYNTPVPTTTPPDAPEPGLIHRIFVVYLRASIGVVAVMVGLWCVGFESIYYHITPLYALYMPVFGGLWLPPLLLAIFAAGVFAWKRCFQPSVPWPQSLPLLMLAGGIAVVLGYLAWLNHEPRHSTWAVVATQVLALTVFGAAFFGVTYVLRRWNWPSNEPDARQTRYLVLGIGVFAFLFPACIAMLRGGPEGISQAYMRYGTEYINDIGRGLSIRGLFRDYLTLHPYLTLHSKAHPPGPVAILWMWTYVVGRSPMALSLATMAMAAAAVAPLYFWVRDMLDKKTAITACAIYVLMPSVVMFSATSSDIFFATMGITTLFLFWRALHRNSLGYQAAAGAMYAVCSLTSFTLIALGAFFAFTGLLRLRDRRAAVLQTAAAMVAAFLLVHVAVRLWSGFDVFAVFHACLAQFQHDQLSLDLQEPRYAGWVYRFLNPFTFFIYAGIPVSMLFIQRFLNRRGTAMPILWVLLATAFVLNLLYMGRGEGERSALYIFAFLAIPAASYLQELQERTRSADPLLLTIACLAFQCWLMESMLYTYW